MPGEQCIAGVGLAPDKLVARFNQFERI
jgi:hypothetical protein